MQEADIQQRISKEQLRNWLETMFLMGKNLPDMNCSAAVNMLVPSDLEKETDDKLINAPTLFLTSPDEGKATMKQQARERIIINGTPRWISGRTMQEVVEKAAKLYAAEIHNYKPREGMTLRDFVEKIYRPNYLPGLSPSCAATYNAYLTNYILPFMGNELLSAITVKNVQKLRQWMADGSKHGMKKNLSEKTIERTTGLLGRLFRIANEMGYITDTPVKKSLLPRVGEAATHHTALSDEMISHIKRTLPEVEDRDIKLFVGLLAYTGMRPEEALGLKWEDLHIEKGYGIISRAVVFCYGSNDPVVKEPKTASSTRTVILPTPLQALLKPYQKAKGFILTCPDNVSPLTASRKQCLWERAKKRLEIKNAVPYDFRVTYGTQLCENGVTSKQCADLLGHADTRMVETIYARRRHESVTKQQALLERMNKDYF